MTNNDSTLHTNGPEEKRSNGKRTALLVGGGVLAGALLVGGGIAIGDALDGDDDERVSTSVDDSGVSVDPDAAPSTGSDDPSAAPSAGTSAATGEVGSADADEINDVIASTATVAASDGLGGVATDVDATNSGGWDVQFEAANGDETTVSVDAEGTARVSDTDVADGDDQGPAGELDTATVDALVTAALGEADGVITDLGIDDDGRSPYDVTVLLADRTSVEIDLGADFAVISSGTDD